MSIHKMLSAHNEMLAAINPSGGNAWWPEDGMYECRLMSVNVLEGRYTEWVDNKPVEHPAITIQLVYQLMQDIEFPHEPRSFAGELVAIPNDPEVFQRNVKRLQVKIANLKGAINAVLKGRNTNDFGTDIELLQSEASEDLVVVQMRVSSNTTAAGKTYKNDRVLSRVEVA